MHSITQDDVVTISKSAIHTMTTAHYLPAEIPQTQGVVPGTRQRKLTIRWQDHVRHKVTVAVKWLLRHAVARFIPSQSPNNQGLVCNTTTATTNLSICTGMILVTLITAQEQGCISLGSYVQYM